MIMIELEALNWSFQLLLYIYNMISGMSRADVKTSFSSCIHAIRDKVRFSSISFLKIVLHSFAQNNDLVRIFRSIFFALVDKLRAKS